MTGADSEDVERFDGDCVVCGTTVRGHRYVALGLFAVMTEHGDGMFFEPDEDAVDVADWHDVPLFRAVHLGCVVAYFEGVAIEADHHRKHEGAEGPE